MLLLAIAGGVSIENKTWAQLKVLVDTAQLVPGQLYRITDFRTRHLIPNTTDYNEGAVEPLIVMAITINKLAAEACSETYPQDTLIFELVDTSGRGGTTGRIIRRKDTALNIDMPFDWRAVKLVRWLDAATGQYISLEDNLGTRQLFSVFNNVAAMSNVFIQHDADGNINNLVFKDCDVVTGLYWTKPIAATVINVATVQHMFLLCASTSFTAFAVDRVGGNCIISDLVATKTFSGSTFKANAGRVFTISSNMITGTFDENIVHASAADVFVSDNTMQGMFDRNTLQGNMTYCNFVCGASDNLFNQFDHNTILSHLTAVVPVPVLSDKVIRVNGTRLDYVVATTGEYTAGAVPVGGKVKVNINGTDYFMLVA